MLKKYHKNRNKLPLLIFCLFLLSFIQCGGVIGNIEQYDYPVTPDKLKIAVETLYKKHPEWIPPKDSSIYHLNGNYFREEALSDGAYYFYYKKPKPMILKIHIIINPDTTFYMPTISLTTGANYGDPIYFARDLKKIDRRLFQKVFECVFLAELNKELKVLPEEY